jgi:hypothetical protein
MVKKKNQAVSVFILSLMLKLNITACVKIALQAVFVGNNLPFMSHDNSVSIATRLWAG